MQIIEKMLKEGCHKSIKIPTLKVIYVSLKECGLFPKSNYE